MLLLISTLLPAQQPSQVMGMDTAALSAMVRGMAAAFSQAPAVPETYAFDLVLDMELVNGNDPVQKMSMMIRNDGTASGVELWHNDTRTTVILDQTNKLNCMLTEESNGRKVGVALPDLMSSLSGFMQSMGQEDAVESAGEASMVKTGRKKTIAGYSCDEYQVKSGNTEALVYMAPDLNWNWGSMLNSSMGNMIPASFSTQLMGARGAVLATESKDPSGRVVQFTTTAVHKNGKTLRTTEYTFESPAMPGAR
jgi:hypothetical protein